MYISNNNEYTNNDNFCKTNNQNFWILDLSTFFSTLCIFYLILNIRTSFLFAISMSIQHILWHTEHFIKRPETIKNASTLLYNIWSLKLHIRPPLSSSLKCPHHNCDIPGSPFKLQGFTWLTPNHYPGFYVARPLTIIQGL